MPQGNNVILNSEGENNLPHPKPTVAGAREACAAAAATRGFPARHVWRCALRNAAAGGEAGVVVESIMAFYDDRYVVSSAEVRVVAPGAH